MGTWTSGACWVAEPDRSCTTCSATFISPTTASSAACQSCGVQAAINAINKGISFMIKYLLFFLMICQLTVICDEPAWPPTYTSDNFKVQGGNSVIFFDPYEWKYIVLWNGCYFEIIEMKHSPHCDCSENIIYPSISTSIQ